MHKNDLNLYLKVCLKYIENVFATSLVKITLTGIHGKHIIMRIAAAEVVTEQ